MTPDTLRYYERIGLLSNVPRTENGIRNYDDKACGRIEFIKCMRDAGENYGISKAFHTDFKTDKLLEENGISVENLVNVIKELE